MDYKHAKVDDVAEKLVREIGFDYAKGSAPMKTGQVYLSHDSLAGGYQIRRVVGSETTIPFLSEERYDEYQMYDLCMFALTAVTLTKKRVVDNVLQSMEKMKQILPEGQR